MKRMSKLDAKTSLRVLAAVGLLGTAISCGDMLKKKDDDKNNPPPPPVKVGEFTVTSKPEGLAVEAAPGKTQDGKAAVLKLSGVDAASQLIAVTGTCPIGSFTAAGEYTTGAIKADCEVVLKAGATASFAFTADKLPKDGQAQFAVVPFGAFNLKKVVAGDCPTVGAWQGNNYSVPVTAACTATFQALAAPYHLTGSANTKVVPTTAQHKFSVTITPSLTDLVEGSGYGVKFDGLAKAAATANLTPSYKLAKVISTTCPQGSQLDNASQIFRVAPLSAGTTSCDVSFEVENPCGVSGIADPTTIKYNSGANRISLLMAGGATNMTKASDGTTEGITGTGSASCTGCHGASRPSTTAYFSYDTKWRVYYPGTKPSAPANSIYVDSLTANSGVWGAQLATTTNTDPSNAAWIGKILFPRTGTIAPTSSTSAGTEGTVDPSYFNYDPLNSRFYRKLTTSHYGTGSSSMQMPPANSTSGVGCEGNATNSPVCLSSQKQEMMCHWIWNGMQL